MGFRLSVFASMFSLHAHQCFIGAVKILFAGTFVPYESFSRHAELPGRRQGRAFVISSAAMCQFLASYPEFKKMVGAIRLQRNNS
jgi:hypothetical protein